MGIIVYAIPVFFILIAFEFIASLILRKKVYRLSDSLNDLSMGMIDQIGGAFLGAIMFGMYLLVWDNFRLFNFGAEGVTDVSYPWWVWVTCFIAKDFGYYWAHRMSHEMNIGWASHIAHHQSEEYNLTVALRQGVFQGFFFNFFYLPLALIGFPPLVYGLCSVINTLYQFWIHTRTVGKLGPIEWIMNTPSHHRVHHGRDEKYIDRNHAGVFIIWDRLFGTFQVEEEEPNYGLVGPLRSWNPLWAQVHYFVKIAQTSWAAPTLKGKIAVWFAAPGYVPEGMEAPVLTNQEKWNLGVNKRYETKTPGVMKLYCVLHFVPVLILTTGFLRDTGAEGFWDRDAEGMMAAGIAAGLLFWTLLNIGGILESQRWLPISEFARIVAMASVIYANGFAYFGMPEMAHAGFQAANIALAVVSSLMLLSHLWVFAGPEFIEPGTDGPYYGPKTADATEA